MLTPESERQPVWLVGFLRGRKPPFYWWETPCHGLMILAYFVKYTIALKVSLESTFTEKRDCIGRKMKTRDAQRRIYEQA